MCSATFVGASLNSTLFHGATLDGAVFDGVDLSDVDWGEGISAKGASFRGCVGVSCQIGSQDPSVHADFSGAFFDGANFSNTDFSNALFVEASLLRGVFIGATFAQADFTSAQMGGVDKSAAANFAFCYMPNVNFTKTNLYGVSFVFATVFGAATRIANTATMEQADFSNAYLAGIDLTGAILRGAKFSNACLVNVDLTTADLSPTVSGSIISVLDGACVQGAVFTQSNLMNADLTNITVAFTRGTIKVRYCNPVIGGSFPPPPDYEPLNYPATHGLDLTTMTAATVCPNGLTVHSNQVRGNDLTAMLTVANPAVQWFPQQCYSPQMSLLPAPLSTAHISSLESQNIVLKKFSLRHFKNLKKLTEDPAAKRYFFAGQELTDQRLKALIHHYRIRQEQTGISTWAVYHKYDKAFIGVCGLANSCLLEGVEINAAVMPAFRGSALVKEMRNALLDYGFKQLQLPFIYSVIESGNVAAEKAIAASDAVFVRQYRYSAWRVLLRVCA